MKILWVTNSVIGAMHNKIFGKPSNGAWMDALLSCFLNANEHSLIIVTTGRVKEVVECRQENIIYYLIPGGFPFEYNGDINDNKIWKELLDREQPDIIQIWGTEFKQGLSALNASNGIPSVIYIQGILDSIARYYDSGIEYPKLKKTVTFRDFIKHDSIINQKNKYKNRARYEAQMLRKSGNIISENLWCDSHIKEIAPDIRIHRCPLSINKVFSEQSWNLESIEKYSIICNASGYPLKGLHMILRAVALLKRKYDAVKLYVPGVPQSSQGSVKSFLRKSGYTKYIEKLIKELDISQNIVWLGHLTQEQLAEQYAQKHVFVLGSALENHSSSLKEAMMTGTPCVASAVGGIPEYVTHGENGFLYRFEEYELMAEYIGKIFDDDLTAQKLSDAGKESQRELHDDHSIYEKVLNIYEELTKG